MVLTLDRGKQTAQNLWTMPENIELKDEYV